MKPLRFDAPSVSLFGVRIHSVTLSAALDIVDQAIIRRERLQIGVLNAAKVVNMRRDPTLHEDVVGSDLILADGIAVVWSSRLLGRSLPERVTGIDLMMGILDRGNLRNYSVYCLGATEEVSRGVAGQLALRYPGVRLAGRHHGYFSEADEPVLVDEIAAARADVLFVAMVSPKKEKFMAQWIERLDVPVCHGVGGSFDVFVGKVARAPEKWQRAGLEWLYRLKQEPRRLWRRYLVTNTLFIGMVFVELWRRLIRGQ
jgi:N-acetylglucosaminyldiphosphoundecaprenol N-acetyl-beta-D-mannosaminyltransferase